MGAKAVIRMPNEGKRVTLAGQPLAFLGAQILRREHHHRYLAPSLPLVQLRQHLKAIQHREHQVQQDHRRKALPDAFQCRQPVRRFQR